MCSQPELQTSALSRLGKLPSTRPCPAGVAIIAWEEVYKCDKPLLAHHLVKRISAYHATATAPPALSPKIFLDHANVKVSSKEFKKDLHSSTLGRQFIAQGDGFIMCWHICVKKGNWTLVLATKINWKLKLTRLTKTSFRPCLHVFINKIYDLVIFLQQIFFFSQHTGLWVVPGYLYMAPGYPGEMCEGCWVVVRRETERVFTHLASPTTNPGRRPSSDLTAPPLCHNT